MQGQYNYKPHKLISGNVILFRFCVKNDSNLSRRGKQLFEATLNVFRVIRFYFFSYYIFCSQQGGLGGLNYPLLSDFNKTIAKDYGVLVEDQGLALRYDCLKPLELQI